MVPGIRRNNQIAFVSNDANQKMIRQRLANYEEQEPRFHEEIAELRKQIRLLTHRSEQMESERDNAQYNSRIWERRVKEQEEMVAERDEAIENLISEAVNAEERLKQNTDLQLKDSKIEDLRVQVKQLKAQNRSMASTHAVKVGNMKQKIQGLLQGCRSMENELVMANKKIKFLEREKEEMKTVKHELGLKNLLIENEAQAAEIRDLKRQLWNAKDSSDVICNLKQALADANRRAKDLELENRSSFDNARKVVEETVRAELLAAQEAQRLLEERLTKVEAFENCPEGLSLMDATFAEYKKLIDDTESTIQSLNKQLLRKTTSLQNSQQRVQELEQKLSSLEPIEKIQIESTTCENCTAGVEAEKEWKRIIDKSQETIEHLQKMLTDCESALNEEKNRVHELEEKLLKANSELASRGEGSKKIEGLIDEAQRARWASEKSFVQAYESQIAEKNTAIEDLHKDLIALRSKRHDEASSLNNTIENLKSQLDNAHSEYENDFKLKDQHIYALEHALHSQEETVQSMKSEIDQLQKLMRDSTANRREEMEMLQQEVMALRTEIKSKEKELCNLRMQVREEQLEYKSEIVNLKETIATYENEVPEARAMASKENDERMLMVKERLQQLKERNAQLVEENKWLSERLEKSIVKVHAIEAECNDAKGIKIECGMLRRQVVELQEILDGSKLAESAKKEFEAQKDTLQNDTIETEEDLDVRNAHESLERSRSMPRTSKERRALTPLRRLFNRHRISSASNAILAADEEVESTETQRSASVGRLGGSMYIIE